MYHMTVIQIPGEWRNREFPVKTPNGCHLHSFDVEGDRVVCMWEQVGELVPDEWGGRVSVSIPEMSGTA